MSCILRIVSGILIFLALVNFIACGSEDNPVAPRTDLQTEVTVNPSEVISGQRPNLAIRLIATTNQAVEVEFFGVGYRVFTADEEMVIENLVSNAGDLDTLLVRQGWDSVIYLELPTLRSHLENTPAEDSWLLEADELSPGEYAVNAGLIGYEEVFLWDESSFIVSETVEFK